MKRTTLAISALTIGLIATNLAWACVVVDQSVTQAYSSQSIHETSTALNQALAILPVAAKPETTREQLVAAARGTEPSTDAFEKDGFVWVGRLGLRFDSQGKLIEATAY